MRRTIAHQGAMRSIAAIGPPQLGQVSDSNLGMGYSLAPIGSRRDVNA
jgi:hypothetical protein